MFMLPAYDATAFAILGFGILAVQGGSNPLTVASTRFLLPTAVLMAGCVLQAFLSFFRGAKLLSPCYSAR